MNGTEKLSPDQKQNWLILEGWQPWVCTYDPLGKLKSYYGLREGNRFVYGSRPGHKDDAGHGVGEAQNFSDTIERSIAWDTIPAAALQELYEEVIRGFY